MEYVKLILIFKAIVMCLKHSLIFCFISLRVISTSNTQDTFGQEYKQIII